MFMAALPASFSLEEKFPLQYRDMHMACSHGCRLSCNSLLILKKPIFARQISSYLFVVNQHFCGPYGDHRRLLMAPWLVSNQVLYRQMNPLWLTAYGSPWWLSWETICLQCGRPRFNPWVGQIRQRRKWQPTPIFLPRKSHGQRSLVGYSPWGHFLLLTAPHITLSHCNNLNPDTFLPSVNNNVLHNCLTLTKHLLTPHDNLQEILLGISDFSWFTDDSYLKDNNGKYCTQYTITTSFNVVEATSLPIATLAQIGIYTFTCAFTTLTKPQKEPIHLFHLPKYKQGSLFILILDILNCLMNHLISTKVFIQLHLSNGINTF